VRVLVVTVSDRAAGGEYEDLSGPAVEEALRECLEDVEIGSSIVPDDAGRIMEELLAGLEYDVVLTTGGTGISPGDVTPEVTESFCSRLVPGIAEALRSASMEQTEMAVLSRAVAGIRGSTLVVNLPGSVRGAEFCARELAPVLPHALAMMRGQGH